MLIAPGRHLLLEVAVLLTWRRLNIGARQHGGISGAVGARSNLLRDPISSSLLSDIMNKSSDLQNSA